MVIPFDPRPRGRPAANCASLSKQHIVKTACKLVKSSTAPMSMRRLAVELGVDTMAIYHYFTSKDELMKAVVSASFADLDLLAPQLLAEPNQQNRLLLLALTYLKCARKLPNLTRLMAEGQQSSNAVASRFSSLFFAAAEVDPINDPSAAVAHDVFVDYLHGYVMSGRRPRKAELEPGVRLICLGMQGVLNRHSVGSPGLAMVAIRRDRQRQ